MKYLLFIIRGDMLVIRCAIRIGPFSGQGSSILHAVDETNENLKQTCKGVPWIETTKCDFQDLLIVSVALVNNIGEV